MAVGGGSGRDVEYEVQPSETGGAVANQPESLIWKVLAWLGFV